MEIIKLNKKYIELDDNDKEYIKNVYYSFKDKSFDVLKKELNISRRTLRQVLKDFNINTKLKNRYLVNSDYFSIIDTEEKAYILGLIASDGYVDKDSNNFVLALNDYEILLKVKNLLNLTNDIRKGKKGGFENSKSNYVLRFSDHKIMNDLTNLGFYKNKSLTYNNIPNIPNNLKRHFLRGYFDGDGCVYAYERIYLIKSKKYIYNRLHMNIIATKPLLMELVNTFNITKYSISKSHTNELFYLNINAKNELKNMYNLMYKDSTIFLNRKRIIWEQNIKGL